MQLHDKSPHLVEAQLALYADEQEYSDHNGRSDTLLSQLGSVSLMQPPQERITYNTRYGAELLFDKAEYLNLLRSTSRDTIVSLASMLQSYEDLAPQIEAMGITSDTSKVATHPAFLGAGRNNFAFTKRLTIGGQPRDAVIIVPQAHPHYSSKSRLNERAVALAKVKGLRGFEQGIAVSHNPAVLVTEKAPGKMLSLMRYPELQTIRADQWQQLTDDVETINGANIRLDGNPDNYLYDPEKGFTIIDFGRTFSSDQDQLMVDNRGTIGTVQIRHRA